MDTLRFPFPIESWRAACAGRSRVCVGSVGLTPVNDVDFDPGSMERAVHGLVDHPRRFKDV